VSYVLSTHVGVIELVEAPLHASPSSQTSELIIAPASVPRTVPNDPEDDQVIAAALAGQADIIVSGDHHLLSLGSHHGIQIMRPADVLASITGGAE
jgi:predicted nucleic acid-binding protein